MSQLSGSSGSGGDGNRGGPGDVHPDEMNGHPDADLSAYADLSLAPEQESPLTAHLAGCVRCARRVDELGAVRRLLAGAPAPRPSRSLVPRLTQVPAWLRPARSLASIGAGTAGPAAPASVLRCSART